MGKVESGTLRMDEEVVLAPTKKKAKVEAIYIGDNKVSVVIFKKCTIFLSFVLI